MSVTEISEETIEKVKEEINKLEEQAITDLVFKYNILDNFDRCNKIAIWSKRLNRWKYLLHAQTEATNKIKSNRYFFYKNEVMAYSLTDKELILKLEADSIYNSYKTYLFYLDVAVKFIEKIISLLDGQRFDLKDKINYLKFLQGED